MRLGEMLIARRLIEPEDLERALEIQRERGEKIGKILVDLGFIATRDVLAALSEQLAVPLVAMEGPPPAAPETEGLAAALHAAVPRSCRWPSGIPRSPSPWPIRWISRPSPRCAASPA